MSLVAMSLARLPLVTLSRTGKSFPVNQGEVILDAALRQEIWLPHACRGGTCGSCKAVIVAGSVTYDEGSPLRTRQAALRSEAYLCCAKAVGDVMLRYRRTAGAADRRRVSASGPRRFNRKALA